VVSRRKVVGVTSSDGIEKEKDTPCRLGTNLLNLLNPNKKKRKEVKMNVRSVKKARGTTGREAEEGLQLCYEITKMSSRQFEAIEDLKKKGRQTINEKGGIAK